MAVQLSFKIQGQTDNICDSASANVTVDCCEKNSDEYKAVHTDDWGDLDIEYTSLVMGCGEQQELSVKDGFGCPPFTWTLVSGGGTLTPAEGNLTAIYESPETNPNCVSNPTILLKDRCGSKELRLAVNCFDPPWNSFAYVEYTICRPCGKAASPFCDMKLIAGRWSYACNGSFNDAFYYGGPTDDDHIATYNCSDPGTYEYLNCGGIGGDITSCTEFQTVCGSNCAELYTEYWTHYPAGYHDVRTQEMKDGGCCPINPSTGLPF